MQAGEAVVGFVELEELAVEVATGCDGAELVRLRGAFGDYGSGAGEGDGKESEERREMHDDRGCVKS